MTMDTKKQTINYKLAITGAFGALTVVLGLTRWGFISLSPAISLTIMHIPVILATLLAGLFPGMGVGLIFGIFSIYQAAVSPSGALDPLFVNPLVSVLPRMLIAVVTWGIDTLLKKIPVRKSAEVKDDKETTSAHRPHLSNIVSGIISAFFGSLSNTVFVIGALYLLYHTETTSAMNNLGYLAGLGILMPNALLEAAAATIITAAFLTGIFAVSKKKSKLSEEQDK